MSNTKFIKEGPDKKGKTYIIEGTEQPGNVFYIKRFICEIVNQENEEETQKVADLVLEKLSKDYKSEYETAEAHRQKCRDYLMQIEPNELTVEDVLESLGFGRNGLQH